MDMDKRKARIFEAIILDYIATAEPIGSRSISKRYNLGVSPATVRNEMSDLEELGLIEQPYTSAGRVPSQKGYRYYVDFLMEKPTITSEVKNYVKEMLTKHIKEAENAAQVAIKLLSQLTNYTAMVLMPANKHCTLEHLQLFPINDGRKIVLVIVLSNGHVEHRTIDLAEPLSDEELAVTADVLNKSLYRLTVDKWKQSTTNLINNELTNRKAFISDTLDLLENLIVGEQDHKLFLGGSLTFLNQPEFKSIDKIKDLLSLLEEYDIIREVLQSSVDKKGLSIRIGDENIHDGMKGCSLIMTTYESDDKSVGTVGLLGPVRMEYAKAIGLIEFIAYAMAGNIK